MLGAIFVGLHATGFACIRIRAENSDVTSPKDTYDLMENTVAAFTQIAPEIVNAKWKIWPPDVNYIQYGDQDEG
jgi:hypothetical protein